MSTLYLAITEGVQSMSISSEKILGIEGFMTQSYRTIQSTTKNELIRYDTKFSSAA